MPNRVNVFEKDIIVHPDLYYNITKVTINPKDSVKKLALTTAISSAIFIEATATVFFKSLSDMVQKTQEHSPYIYDYFIFYMEYAYDYLELSGDDVVAEL